MTPRAFAATGVMLSPVTFGSMRLHEKPHGDDDWVRLLEASYSAGVTTMHASTEYESYRRFCALVRRLGARNVQHIVKLAEPHFGDAGFDRARLVAKVDAYLSDLGAARLDVVQWMWRGDLKDEPGRLAGFRAQMGDIVGAFAALRAQGKIGAVAPFPYTQGFGDEVIAAGAFDGLTVYVNPLEQDMLPQLARGHERGMSAVAIRPFGAGKALAATSARACIEQALRTPGVASAVASYSSVEHLTQLVAAASFL